MNKILRIVTLIVFGLLVMGVGLAAEVAGIIYYHMYKEGALDLAIIVSLYILAVLTLFSLIMSFLTAFIRKFAISLITSILFFLSFAVYISVVAIYYAQNSIIIDITRALYSEKMFGGIYQKFEESAKCCGYDNILPRCSQYTQTCGSVIKNGVDSVATQAIIIIMAALGLIGAIFAIIAADEDRRNSPKRIGNDETEEMKTNARYPRRRPCLSDSSYEYVEEEEYIYEEEENELEDN